MAPSGLYSMSQGQVNQSYSHLGHELAHPLGSGFQELLIRGQFLYKMSFFRFKLIKRLVSWTKIIERHLSSSLYSFLDA